MDKASAQGIVSKTFKAAFDRKRFRDFISELCNGFDESKAISSMRVPDAFSDHVKSCQRLGTFESAEGELTDVLIVHLTESYKLERSRTALRDFVAHKLKREESYKEAGLVAFVAPGSQSWRFSYVRMEYETRRDPKTGKIKVEERLTPARRYSYLVGADEVCHTAQSRFLPLLQNTSDKPTLAQIENAFSVESVSKEFFAEYARLFMDTEAALAALVDKDKTLHADFEAKHVNTTDFTKKLLGQIVFLYFIQKKGWLGVAKGGKWGDGPRHFLRMLANQAIEKNQNLFNDVLEPLFYDTLATDRGHEAWCETFQCRIPFLNGGLFEPLAGYDWENTEITLPNTLLTNRETNKAGDIGTGILDVFDRYNFTVMEDEPLEKEVAIDPEMLGKVFENLIEENRRKGLGTFYTPREIVHYMCQESLINYLDTALNHPLKPLGMSTPDHLTVRGELVEPPTTPDSNAVHATVRADTTVRGEFTVRGEPVEPPIRIEHTVRGEPVEPPQLPLVPREELAEWISQSDQFAHYAAAIAAGTKGDHYPKPPASIRKYAREIDELLRDITVCDPAVGSGAFLVGMMNEIVRARMALTPYFNDIAERTAYHFKRRAIQYSLYGVDIDAGAVEIAKLRLWLSLVVDEEDVQQIKPLPNLDYKIVVGNSLIGVEKNLFNQERFKRLEELKPKFFNESDRKKKAQFKKQIDDLIHDLTNGREVFDYEIYFSEVFHSKQGFDVVIANPPYVGEKGHKEVFQQLRVGMLKKFYQKKMDIFYFFFHQSLNVGNTRAHIAFITTNYFPTATGAQTLRTDFSNRSSILKLVNFNELKIFDSAQGQHNMVTLLAKGRDNHSKVNTCITKRKGSASAKTIEDILAWRDTETDYFEIGQTDIYEGASLQIRLRGCTANDDDPSQTPLDKMKRQGELLGSVCNVNQGLRTGADKVTNKHFEECNLDTAKYFRGEGIFILKRNEVDLLPLTPYERKRILPLFKNSDVHQYYCTEDTQYSFIDLSWPADRGLDLSLVPNLIRHLSKYRAILENRKENANGLDKAIANGYWWPMSVRRKLDFTQEKIVAPQRSKRNVFGYNEVPWYASADVYFITVKDRSFHLKYVLALLNSKLFFLWLYHKGKRKGEMLELYQTPLSEIPIKRISPREQMPFIELADRILTAKQRDADADVSALEREIDELVYALYGLTPDEIALIETAR